MKKQIISAICLVVLMCPLTVLAVEKVSVAVAADFILVFKDMAADFEEKTGVKVEAVFASSDNLYRQIKKGAPYDVFLSADEEHPARLQKKGLTQGTIVYARGKVILWSANNDFCRASNWQEAIKNSKGKKIALANPRITLYGAAAKAALKKADLWNNLRRNLVNTNDVDQSFQMASAKEVEAAFCSIAVIASAEGKEGCYFNIAEIPEIMQFACLMKKSKNHINAELFASYLLSKNATEIRKKYGFR